MKKMSSNLLIAITLSCISPVLANIFIQNNYDPQSKIQYVELPAIKANSTTELKPTILGYGGSAEVRRLGTYDKPWRPERYLSISTIGGSYYDISYVYNQIQQEEYSHQGEDAIIMIYPRLGGYGWYPKVEWVKQSSK